MPRDKFRTRIKSRRRADRGLPLAGIAQRFSPSTPALSRSGRQRALRCIGRKSNGESGPRLA